MSRSDTYVGLNDWASDFVSKPSMKYTDHVRRVYEDGAVKDFELTGKACLVKSEASGEFVCGMFDQEYPLQRYTFPDGTVVTEFEQACPWSSGPVMFIALKDQNGNAIPESLWSTDEIDMYL